MIVAVVSLSVACACLMGALAFCIVRIGALVGHIERLDGLVERSLDALDDAHRNIAKSAGHDVMSDDIFVRRVVGSLMHAKKTVHEVAGLLASFDEEHALEERSNEQRS